MVLRELRPPRMQCNFLRRRRDINRLHIVGFRNRRFPVGASCEGLCQHEIQHPERNGGVIVFGGGLALYNGKRELVGALGVSGDLLHGPRRYLEDATQLKTRHGADERRAGPSDHSIFDIQNGASATGFGYPTCKGGNPRRNYQSLESACSRGAAEMNARPSALGGKI